MNLSHLNFAQLYRLQSAETKMRVARAYHNRLRRLWREHPDLRQDEEFSVYRARDNFPEEAASWLKVLRFLCGAELKKATRLAADKWPIQLPPTLEKDLPWISICTLEASRFPNQQIRHALAGLIIRHAKLAGLVAYTQTHTVTGDFRIVANCTAHGPVTLLYQSGLPWDYVQHASALYNLAPFEVLPWLALADLRPTTRVNPMQWPTNTPDFYECGKALAYND